MSVSSISFWQFSRLRLHWKRPQELRKAIDSVPICPWNETGWLISQYWLVPSILCWTCRQEIAPQLFKNIFALILLVFCSLLAAVIISLATGWIGACAKVIVRLERFHWRVLTHWPYSTYLFQGGIYLVLWFCCNWRCWICSSEPSVSLHPQYFTGLSFSLDWNQVCACSLQVVWYSHRVLDTDTFFCALGKTQAKGCWPLCTASLLAECFWDVFLLYGLWRSQMKFFWPCVNWKCFHGCFSILLLLHLERLK